MSLKETHHQFIKEVILGYYPVNERLLEQLISIAAVRKLKKNEILLPVGRIAKEIYMVYSGAIIAYFLDNEGNTYNKNIFLEGDLAGSTVSSLTNSPSKFALEAIEECEIISINFSQYRKLIFDHDEMKNFYIAYLENNWIFEKEKREIDIVMKDAGSRYLELLEKHPDLDERIPLVHIASHLGITPTQLSRIRKKVKK
ncbi:Crp/Fnr family transcriptional regulator [Flexithrix dorotheae]|uniref:Crp/Fnr family transcriptional regulator n=1 Tax=Flexithrix dorotheae TaxID=70993 RepID=UPI000370557B|nr:Crp/Fnr family transcriptional regulator [Flexithrix dorotheae]